MAKLKALYKTKEEIPAEIVDYYAEKDGQFYLDVEGGKTDKDVATVQEALRKERADHKKTKDTLGLWTVLGDSIETVQESLDRIPELEAASVAAGNDPKEAAAKQAAAVEAVVGKERVKLQRIIDAEKKRADDATALAGTLQGEKKSRAIKDAVRDAAVTAKIIPQALDDVLLYGDHLFDVDEAGKVVGKEGTPVAGIEPAAWIADQGDKKPHWWPISAGGGAGGGSGGGGNFADNPWSAANWNVTKQNEIIKTKGETRADAMAKAVGSRIGAMDPPKAAK